MTTLTLEKPRFTVQVGDHTVDLPEADTRDEALRKAGLTPAHWQQTPISKHQQGKATAKSVSKPHSTTRKTKKPQPRITVSKKVVNKQKTVTIPKHCNDTCNDTNTKCQHCGQLFMAFHPKAKYCSVKCRVAAFRKNN